VKPPAPTPDRTPLEVVLLRDRWLIGGSLAVTIALCWGWIIPMARDMYGAMTGPSAWMMTDSWDFTHQALLLAMWVVMMVGMMLPSAAPTLLLYAGVIRKSEGTQRAAAHVYAFAGAYVLVWAAFSLGATVLQLLLARWLLLSPMMEARNQALSGGLLIAAGLYQLTPWKRACLSRCRSPAEFLVQRWQRGLAGAFRMGLAHGLFCLGCCWALMLLLFVGGVMNLWCIGVLTVFVLLIKLAKPMRRSGEPGAVSRGSQLPRRAQAADIARCNSRPTIHPAKFCVCNWTGGRSRNT
jgi:predicted metal-binding membrane protein